MKLFKNYKKLYLAELENRKKLITQNSKLSAERVKAMIELEDTKKFLEMEKECSNALRKERTKLRKMVTKLGGDWKDEK